MSPKYVWPQEPFLIEHLRGFVHRGIRSQLGKCLQDEMNETLLSKIRVI